MILTHVALLFAAGLAAGTVNAVAGGGSLIMFPALLATGLGAVAGNVTNAVAVLPGYLASGYGSRTDLDGLAAARGRRALLALVPTATVGAGIGCVLLLATPARTFDVVVPFLVLGATAALAQAGRLRRLVGHPARLSPRRRAVTLHAMVGLGAVYGGYFGAALGIMLVAGLALVVDEPLSRIGALKNAVSAVVGFVTLLVFAVFGPVDWADVALLVPATMTGGYLGARLAGRLAPALLRALIVAFGAVVGTVLLWRSLA